MRSGSRYQPTRPAYFLLDLADPRRESPPARESGLWGRLDVELEALTDIHVGGTAPVVVDLGGRETLVHGMTSLPDERGRVVVVPGSSVKGAVRAVVEALTPSCDRLSRERGASCRDASALCPACATFGAPGWRATVAFSDLLPTEPVNTQVRRVAQRFSHRHAARKGRRLYGLRSEEPLPDAAEALECLPSGARLRGEVFFEGVTEVLAGVTTLALGLAPHGLPLLRLGAGKNRGLAQARVTLRSSAVARNWAAAVRNEHAPVDLAALQESALDRWPDCRSFLEQIRRHYS